MKDVQKDDNIMYNHVQKQTGKQQWEEHHTCKLNVEGVTVIDICVDEIEAACPPAQKVSGWTPPSIA